jgi:hypothetical protein
MLLCSLLFLVGGLQATAPAKDFSKVIIKEFVISPDQMVKVTNKYGQVDVEGWDSDQVKFTIEIVVDARSEEAAEEVYERINIIFNEDVGTISATTELESQSRWSISLFGWNTGNEFSINYKVMMPRANALSVSNKYGNTNIRGVSSRMDHWIKYGNLHVYDNVPSMDLYVGYGEAKIQDVENFDAELAYSDLRTHELGDAKIRSKYSDVRTEDVGTMRCWTKYDDYVLGRVSELRNEGKYDDFEIEEVSEINMYSSYTDVFIRTLYHFADVSMRYGEFSVGVLDQRFRAVELSGQYTDYRLGTRDLTNYDIDVQGSYSDWSWTNDMKLVKSHEDGSDKSYEGHLGSSGKGGKITADLRYGSLVLK